jgi:putative transposase
MMGKFLHWLQERFKHWTKPTTPVLIIGILSNITRSHTDLVVENALLREQLIVLNRQIKRPQLTNPDRFRFVFLSHFTKFWKQALHIVQPDTLMRWHWELSGMYWRRKSQGQPKISPETIALIHKMAGENQIWGAERIRGELLKLGIEVSKRAIQRYMPKERKEHSSSHNWATFLKNQASGIWACDFTVVNDWLFRQWYVFVVMEMKTRRIVHTGVTKYPTDEWTAQQLREATPWGTGPKYLIRDRDRKYAVHFSTVAAGIKELKTPYRTRKRMGFAKGLWAVYAENAWIMS